MKKLIFTFALTLALTAGIASPISAAAQVNKKTTSITPVEKGGGNDPGCELLGTCRL